MHSAPGDRRPRSRQLARQPRGTPTRRHAADVAGTHRSRRPVEAPDLALLRNPGDPYGNHQPGSSLQGSPLRLRYSAWLVIRSLPVHFGFATAQAYAGHEDHGRGGKAIATYIRAGLPEVATALAALTSEDHPLAISAPSRKAPIPRPPA
jgi:hypothetical protein